jgi:hypothetical protein
MQPKSMLASTRKGIRPFVFHNYLICLIVRLIKRKRVAAETQLGARIAIPTDIVRSLHLTSIFATGYIVPKNMAAIDRSEIWNPDKKINRSTLYVNPIWLDKFKNA